MGDGKPTSQLLPRNLNLLIAFFQEGVYGLCKSPGSAAIGGMGLVSLFILLPAEEF